MKAKEPVSVIIFFFFYEQILNAWFLLTLSTIRLLFGHQKSTHTAIQSQKHLHAEICFAIFQNGDCIAIERKKIDDSEEY